MATVAVLGTGTMGSTVARQLLDAETDLHVWNRTGDKAEPLGDDGAMVADTPADAARGAKFVITVVSDANAVEEVMTGEDGALESMDDDAVWLQMSTVGLGIDRLAELARERGTTLVDAPVFSTKDAPEERELVIFAAGPEELRERCQPIFDAIGDRTSWVGEVGAASRLKLVLNGWHLGLAEALAETMALAEALDVDAGQFLEFIQDASIGVPYAQTTGEQMMKREFSTNFPLRLALKDAGLVVDAGEERGLDLPLARIAAGQFAVAVGKGYGDEDMAAVIRAVTGEAEERESEEAPAQEAETEEAAAAAGGGEVDESVEMEEPEEAMETGSEDSGPEG